MIRHVLLIQFKPAVSAQAIDTLKQQFFALAERIDGICGLEWGENNSPEQKNQGFTHCVLMSFDDEHARDRYLPHPEHQAFVEIFGPTLQDIIVFDYAPS